MLLRDRLDPTRFMETLGQHQRFKGSDRLHGLFSQSESAAAAPLELNEDDIFLTGSESPTSPTTNNPNPNPSFSAAVRHRISDRNFGILATLPECNPNPNLNLTPKLSISFSSSAMMIPPSARLKPKEEKAYHSSAPVSIPVANRRDKGFDLDLDGDDEEMMMLPPHEIVARREGRESSPLTTFSVLDGAGRTLKGKDLRRVRNSVFRRTGIVD